MNSQVIPEASYCILGVGYQIGSGKDTIADQLCDKYNFIKMRFADTLKETVSLIFGWPRESLDDQEFKAEEDPFWGISPRTALQKVGTEAMRNAVREDIWVKALEHRIARYVTGSCNETVRIVIPDVRFPNEVEAIKAWGGKLIHVERPCNIWTPAGESNAKHSSETALAGYKGWDYHILNDGTLTSLAEKVEAMIAGMQLSRV